LFEAPKINIDINPANEYYGAINFVDINATSVCELLVLLFEKFEQQAVDEDMATALLVGIISRTHSFQHSHTTPRAFLKASELIALGGRQQEIIKNLFKTKPLPLLRLWGRAMARLKIHDSLPVMYSLLNLSDFGKAGASNEDLQLVLKELLDSVSGYKVIGLLSESMGGQVCVQMALHQQVDMHELEKSLGGLTRLDGLSGPFSIVQAELKNISLTDAEELFIQGLHNAIDHTGN
jgi:phosphoesterase RecJ-like protein